MRPGSGFEWDGPDEKGTQRLWVKGQYLGWVAPCDKVDGYWLCNWADAKEIAETGAWPNPYMGDSIGHLFSTRVEAKVAVMARADFDATPTARTFRPAS